MNPHTTPCSLTEREVGTPGQIGAIRRETVRVKSRWTLPEIRVAVSKILTRKDQGSRWDVVPSDLIIGERSTRDSPDGWVQAHGFLEHHARVRQGRQVLDGGCASSELRRQLSLKSVLDVRV